MTERETRLLIRRLESAAYMEWIYDHTYAREIVIDVAKIITGEPPDGERLEETPKSEEPWSPWDWEEENGILIR